jgi:hypothetical protein
MEQAELVRIRMRDGKVLEGRVFTIDPVSRMIVLRLRYPPGTVSDASRSERYKGDCTLDCVY